MNFFRNLINKGLRIFSTMSLKTVQERRIFQYRFDHITALWINKRFPNLEAKTTAKKKAKICAACKFAKIQPGNDKKLIFSGRLFLVKKFVCLKHQKEVTTFIDQETHCPIGKW